jgi:AcrR family transcriptional regulator
VKVSRDDVIAAAMARFDAGDRVDMQELAAELGVSRVTLYRRVSGREELLGEAIRRVAERTVTTLEGIWHGLPEPRELRSVWVLVRFNAAVAANRGMRTFLDAEPEMAIRVLTDPRGLVQPYVTEAIRQLIAADEEAGRMVPVIEAGALAYALVRLGESFLYADILASRETDVDAANVLEIALLKSGEVRDR